MRLREKRECFVREMVAWLNRKFAPEGTVILSRTPLFADGLINSMRILEIIAWVERAVGYPIGDTQIRTDNFYSVQRIADVFLKEESHVVA